MADQIGKATPGPWKVEDVYDGGRTVAIMRDYRLSRTIALHVNAKKSWVGTSEDETVIANANLVAAAPDLLEAARIVAQAWDAKSLTDWERNQLRAAITKAEGLTP